MRRSIILALALVAIAAGTANAQACKGLVPDLEAVAGTNGITQFVNLLKQVGTLGAGPYTFFAPSDAAIAGAIQALGVGGSPATWTPQQENIVTNLALYHVAPGNLPTTGISKFGASLTSLADNLALCKGTKTEAGDKNVTDNFNSLDLKISATDVVTITAGANTATVTDGNIKVKCQPNIVIHKIDKVLLPCDVSKYLKEPLPSPEPSPEPSPSPTPSPAKCKTGSTVFKALTGDVDRAALLPSQLRAVIQPEFVGTVFVPADTAVSALQESLGVTADSIVALQTSTIFSELLSYHIVPTVVYAPTAPGTRTLATLLASNTKQTFCKKPSPGTLSAVSTATSVTVTGGTPDSAKVVSSITTCTGVIHVIDTILLPCTPPSNIQALLKAADNTTLPTATKTNGTDPTDPTTDPTDTDPTATPSADGSTLTGSGAGTGSRGVTLVGGNTSATNTTPASSTTAPKNAAAAALPPAALALVLAFLLAHLF